MLGTPISARPARECSSCGRPMNPGPGRFEGRVVDATCCYCVNQGPFGSRAATRAEKFGRKGRKR